MNWSKQKLVDYVNDLENNNENLKKNFETQYQNCMKIVNDMNVLNGVMNNKIKGSDE